MSTGIFRIVFLASLILILEGRPHDAESSRHSRLQKRHRDGRDWSRAKRQSSSRIAAPPKIPYASLQTGSVPETIRKRLASSRKTSSSSHRSTAGSTSGSSSSAGSDSSSYSPPISAGGFGASPNYNPYGVGGQQPISPYGRQWYGGAGGVPQTGFGQQNQPQMGGPRQTGVPLGTSTFPYANNQATGGYVGGYQNPYMETPYAAPQYRGSLGGYQHNPAGYGNYGQFGRGGYIPVNPYAGGGGGGMYRQPMYPMMPMPPYGTQMNTGYYDRGGHSFRGYPFTSGGSSIGSVYRDPNARFTSYISPHADGTGAYGGSSSYGGGSSSYGGGRTPTYGGGSGTYSGSSSAGYPYGSYGGGSQGSASSTYSGTGVSDPYGGSYGSTGESSGPGTSSSSYAGSPVGGGASSARAGSFGGMPQGGGGSAYDPSNQQYSQTGSAYDSVGSSQGGQFGGYQGGGGVGAGSQESSSSPYHYPQEYFRNGPGHSDDQYGHSSESQYSQTAGSQYGQSGGSQYGTGYGHDSESEGSEQGGDSSPYAYQGAGVSPDGSYYNSQGQGAPSYAGESSSSSSQYGPVFGGFQNPSEINDPASPSSDSQPQDVSSNQYSQMFSQATGEGASRTGSQYQDTASSQFGQQSAEYYPSDSVGQGFPSSDSQRDSLSRQSYSQSDGGNYNYQAIYGTTGQESSQVYEAQQPINSNPLPPIVANDASDESISQPGEDSGVTSTENESDQSIRIISTRQKHQSYEPIIVSRHYGREEIATNSTSSQQRESVGISSSGKVRMRHKSRLQSALRKCENQDNGLPDLYIDPVQLRQSVIFERREMTLLQCAKEEKCLGPSAYGDSQHTPMRALLKFATVAHNNGTKAFLPELPKKKWIYHSCHKHYHSMLEFAHYDLLDADGKLVAHGHKPSFCLEDSGCINPCKPKFDCEDGRQGISPGCHDDYLSSRDCQWIDVTFVPAGRYTLRVNVNPMQRVEESSYDNNVVECDIEISLNRAWARSCHIK